MSDEGVLRFSQLSLWVVLLLLLVGCSTGAGGAPPTAPTIDGSSPAASDGLARAAGDYSRCLWSYHLIRVDPSTNEFEVIQVREALAHWNVLQFLEQSPCLNCLNITSASQNPDGTLSADVCITHPFMNKNLTGFDVRGIAMFNGSRLFPESGLVMSDRTLGEGELVNADGYTTLYNPTTAGHGLEGYIQGALATATAPNATLNGYKYFVSNDPANVRNAFYAGEEITVTHQIDMPDSPNPWVFGYAVDACWAPPIEKPVDDPMTDFGPEANCPETWKIDVTEDPIITNGLIDCGGQAVLSIYIYDWQGKDDLYPVLVECPGLFDGEIQANWTGDGVGFSRYEAVVENVNLASVGIYRCLISKEAQENDPAKPWLDITAYQIHELEVDPGAGFQWARTWGGSDDDHSYAAAVDGSGNVYVTGLFRDTVDFDPGPGVDDHTAQSRDVFLSKLDSSGSFVWAKTWGGSDNDAGYAVAVDGAGNVYVTGESGGTVDFDPGPGVDNHTFCGTGAFLSRFDSSGSFTWAKTWGADPLPVGSSAGGSGLDVNGSDSVYVTGIFGGAVDFDPGPGDDGRMSNGDNDIFLSKFDSSGSFQWASTWGGSSDDGGEDVAADGSGKVYVTGYFSETVDFDPGPGVDNRTSNGWCDVFLSTFDSTGNPLWAYTWGAGVWDHGRAVAVDGSDNVYATGVFRQTVDFDPGPGVDNHVSNGADDIFLSKFDSSGSFEWARTWGDIEYDFAGDVAVDASSSVYVTGGFGCLVDFDPGPGVDYHKPNYAYDAFLSTFDSSGNFQWAITWGGTATDSGYAAAVDGSGNVYVTGPFYSETETVDFDPCLTEDWHDPNGGYDVFLSKFSP